MVKEINLEQNFEDIDDLWDLLPKKIQIPVLDSEPLQDKELQDIDNLLL